MSETTQSFTPTDEDWCGVRDVLAQGPATRSYGEVTDAILATIGPIIERRERAAKVEVPRDLAAFEEGVYPMSTAYKRLRKRADEIERGE